MRLVATVWFFLVFALTAPIVFLIAALLWLFTGAFDRQRNVLHAVVCHLCHQYLRCWPGWRLSVEGREHIPPGPCVLVANHQSIADVFAAMGLYRRFKFVSKASLFQLPLIGWTMTLLRYVRVERGSPQSMRLMLQTCKTWLADGMPVLLFPEGTYREGELLLPFKRGPFRLARECGVPIVPVVLRGTDALVRGDGPWMSPRAAVSVIVLEPISPPVDESEELELAERVRARMAEVLRNDSKV